MKTDQLINKRFEELLKKAEDIADTESEEAVDTEKFHEWGTSVLSLINRIFGEDSDHYKNFKKFYDKFDGYADSFKDCRGILIAAKEDHERGYIFNLKSLVNAEVLSNLLEQAEELLKANYKDPACIVAGVSLETALKDLCNRNGISIGKLDRMNADLCKAEIYNLGMQKQITTWADRRNNAAHGNWGAYTSDDIEDMIKGVKRFVAQYL